MNEFDGRRPVQREPSYIGIHELGAFSGVALTIAFASIVIARRSRLGWLAGVAGGLGVALAAALDARRRDRGRRSGRRGHRRAPRPARPATGPRPHGDRRRGRRCVGSLREARSRRSSSSSAYAGETQTDQTYRATRIGRCSATSACGSGSTIRSSAPAGRIRLSRPGSRNLAAAHRRFPDEPAAAFPSPEHRWGVQNGVIQTLADLGASAWFCSASSSRRRASRVASRIERRRRSGHSCDCPRRADRCRSGLHGNGAAAGHLYRSPPLAVARSPLSRVAPGARLGFARGDPDAPARAVKREPSAVDPGWCVRRPLADWLRDEGRARRGSASSTSAAVEAVLPVLRALQRHTSASTCRRTRSPTCTARSRRSRSKIRVRHRALHTGARARRRPCAAVRELHRVTAPGGRVLASTHGTQVYHPNPGDYWRWTHTGLERLFTANGDWERVDVEPNAGTASALAMLVARSLHLLAKRAGVAWAARPFVYALNSPPQRSTRTCRRCARSARARSSPTST